MKRFSAILICLACGTLAFAQVGRRPATSSVDQVQAVPATRAELLESVDRLSSELEQLTASHQRTVATSDKISVLHTDLGEQVTTVCDLREGAREGSREFERAFNALCQASASSNLQSLRLQQSIQNESRKFQTISNVMKNRHDTVKSAINNIR
jgi:septal ring factor EnvC (AmiA/AmiB activator)